MFFHIGEIIHKEVQAQNKAVKEVESAINRSEQVVYRIYREENIDTGVLIQLSVFLGKNLFLSFQEHESLKLLPNPQIDELKKLIAEKDSIIARKEAIIAEKDKRIGDLEDLRDHLKELNTSLKKL